MYTIRPFVDRSCMCIIGLDPSSSELGFGSIWVDPKTFEIVHVDAFTIYGRHYLKGRESYEDSYGAMHTRLLGMGEDILSLFNFLEPISIAAEAPFISMRTKSAFEPLISCVNVIRDQVHNYDDYKVLHMYTPSEAKKALSGIGSGGKDGVAGAFKTLFGPIYRGPRPLTTLETHCTDAVAIAYCRYLELLAAHRDEQRRYGARFSRRRMRASEKRTKRNK